MATKQESEILFNNYTSIWQQNGNKRYCSITTLQCGNKIEIRDIVQQLDVNMATKWK